MKTRNEAACCRSYPQSETDKALQVAAGCVVIEGHGSRVRFAHGHHVVSFHRPHPAKEAKPYQVEDAREFLAMIGFKP